MSAELKIDILQAKIDAINEFMEEVSQSFTSVITNSDIPLSKRWNFWLKAPSSLKKTRSFMAKFTTYNFQWYDDLYIEKYQTVNMAHAVARIEAMVKKEQGIADNKSGMVLFFCENPKKIDALKEEILQLNLESFIFDW